MSLRATLHSQTYLPYEQTATDNIDLNISAKGKGCYNKDYGLFHVDDVINNINWTVIKK